MHIRDSRDSGADAGSRTTPHSDNNFDWTALVHQLKVELPNLVDAFLERVGSIPAYSSGMVEEHELRIAATESLTLVIDSLGNTASYSKLQLYARNLGEQRAQQGIPVEALTSAVRLNFPVIWAALVELAGTEHLSLLATRVESVWRVLDDYAVACYSSYVATRIREARTEVSVRQEFVAEVLTRQGGLPEVQERFSRVFNTPIDTPYLLMAVSGRPTPSMSSAAKRSQFFLHQSHTHSYLFWPERSSSFNDARGIQSQLLQTPCGLARSEGGLGDLRNAAEHATVLADHVSTEDTVPLTLETHWPRIVRRSFDALGVNPAASLMIDLSFARAGEDDRILETVSVFLANGSVALTADQLFTHRNTVLNRLRRFTELTGLDLRVPTQSALAVIALLD